LFNLIFIPNWCIGELLNLNAKTVVSFHYFMKGKNSLTQTSLAHWHNIWIISPFLCQIFVLEFSKE